MTTDINSIRRLLAADIARMKRADQDAADAGERLAEPQDDPDVSDCLHTELHTHRAIASEARQSFSARTEMLQHLDLGDTTVDELVASVVGALGGGPGGGPSAPGTEAPPTVSAPRTIDQDDRHFLNTHHR